MGYPPSEARSALRLSLGRRSSDADVEMALDVLPATIERLRQGMATLARTEPADGARDDR
jgi:cysteine sulfinate desulfinase/cysteine desulfurase-like protein